MMELNDRELSTILAALRMWQQSTWRKVELENIVTNDGTVVPLDNAEIDALCQRINTGG
jgi:hypothetical protein